MALESNSCVSAIRFEDVSFSYKESDAPAVNHIDLDIKRGTCVLLTGRSGCGKTTLTRLMNGLIPVVYEGVRQGRVSLLEKPLEDWRMDEVSAHVGSVFQNPRSQFVNMDTTSEIAFGCENLGLSQPEIVSRVKKVARELGIENLLGRSVEELSGGQKQLVILASACAVHPDILVLDEPTASLDVRAMKALGKALLRLKAQGKTIIVSEHRLWWLADVADRVVHIENGSIKGEWEASEFAAIPSGLRTSWGLRAWNILEVDECLKDYGAPSNVAEPSIHASNLVVGYRRNPNVLDGLDFEVAPGRVVALVGRNGAGKTTLARCLAGLVRERSGEIRLRGQPLAFRKRAGLSYLVMQEPGYQLFANTVERELEDSLRRGTSVDESSAKAAYMLEDLGMLGLSGRHPLSLSGGERQRLSIGAGLLYGASTIVMDEPTSGLDFTNMARIASQIDSMKKSGVGICIITHDYEFLCEACDEVACLDGGRVVERFPLNDQTIPKIREYFGF